MKASLTLRENAKNPIIKAKVPSTIFGIPFCSGIQFGDYYEHCISFTTAFSSGPLIKLSYRPNDPSRPFGLILRTGAGEFSSPLGSPVSISVEFSLIGNNCQPRFLLHFKPRSGDFSVRRSVESPLISFSPRNQDQEPSLMKNGVVPGEKLNWSWNQLFSSAYQAVSDGEVCATTSVPINRAVVRLGWSMKFPAPLTAAESSDGGSRAETLLNELPHLVLRKIAIERVAEDKREHMKKRGKGDNAAQARLGLNKRELNLLKSEKMKDEILGFEGHQGENRQETNRQV